jgi:predicted ATP-binding protein involved in virulence
LELVYLWVKKYKNIKEQGFNFSPKFTYSYDAKTKELTYKEEDSIKNFFDEEGKVNITAIVGENGSGKSSVLEILTQISYEDNIKNIGSFFYLLKDGESYKCFSYDLSIRCDFTECINKPLRESTLESIREHDKIKIFLTQHINVAYLNISHFERDKIIKNDKRQDLDKLIYLGVFHKNNFTKGHKDSTRPVFDEFNPSNFHFNQIQRIINLIKIPDYKELIFRHLNIKSIYYLGLSYDEKIVFDELDAIEKKTALSISQQEIEEFKKILDDSYFEIESDKFDSLFKSLNHIFENQEEIPFRFTLYSKSKTPIYLSGGENTILFYIEKIALLLDKLIDKKKSTVLLFDEVELYLHPNWQKKIISIILEIFKIEFLNKPIQLIITSHSPFILSDLAKENIIFLKDGKNDKGINHKQTFGANIHTLLSDSFFMDEGLMGEFAKNKIKKIVKQLNDHKEKKIELTIPEQENIKKVIQAIGEPFLNQKLWNMYQSLFNDTDAEEKRLNDEMARIQKKLESLKK